VGRWIKAKREAEQHSALDDFAEQLAYWELISNRCDPAPVTEYVVPVDPMDDLHCDSCQ